MDRKKELVEQANKMFKESDTLYSVPCDIPRKDIKWGDMGQDDGATPWGNRVDEKFKFSSYFWYNEKLDMLTVWGRGLGILYWKGVWATRNKPVKQPDQPIYQIF